MTTPRRKPGAATTRKATQKSAQTRVRLLDAAVTCLWKYGYAGTTLNAVAKEAGLSRGPQQYYFPSRVDLMLGVWDYVSEQLSVDYGPALEPGLSHEERIDAMLDVSIGRAGSRAHVAELELKLATRGDPELRAVLQDLINAREAEADRAWVGLFSEGGQSPEDLIAHRYTMVSMIHGLAIERISGRPADLLARMEAEKRRISHELLKPVTKLKKTRPARNHAQT